MEKERKFNYTYGELVRIRDEKGKHVYQVIGLSYSYEFSDGESMELITYDLKNTKSGEISWSLHETEMEKIEVIENKELAGSFPKPKKLSNKEIDCLLDMYNDSLSLNELYDSLVTDGINVENDYMNQANEVIDYLHESASIK